MQPSNKPFVLKAKDKNGIVQDKFYVRSGNSSQKISLAEMPAYLSEHISRDGFSAITDRLVPVNRPILIEVASILRKARIVWQNDVTIGAEFVTPLTQGELQGILSGSPPTI